VIALRDVAAHRAQGFGLLGGITHSPIGTISPLCSAIGTKSGT